MQTDRTKTCANYCPKVTWAQGCEKAALPFTVG